MACRHQAQRIWAGGAVPTTAVFNADPAGAQLGTEGCWPPAGNGKLSRILIVCCLQKSSHPMLTCSAACSGSGQLTQRAGVMHKVESQACSRRVLAGHLQGRVRCRALQGSHTHTCSERNSVCQALQGATSQATHLQRNRVQARCTPKGIGEMYPLWRTTKRKPVCCM